MSDGDYEDGHTCALCGAELVTYHEMDRGLCRDCWSREEDEDCGDGGRPREGER